jgi:hypothetical protein
VIALNLVPRKTRILGDFAEFKSYLRTLRGDLLKQEACLTARAAIKFTPPVIGTRDGKPRTGGGEGDKARGGEWGMRAVDKDIRSIFAPPGSTLSSIFAGNRYSRSHFAAWRSKNAPKNGPEFFQTLHSADEDKSWEQAKNLYAGKPTRHKTADNIGQMATLHRKERRKGIIVRAGGPSPEVRAYPHIVKNALINKYIKLRQRAVGKMKAGWWKILNTYGRNLTIFGRTVNSGIKGLPAYITRHNMNTGSMLTVNTDRFGRIVITNSIGDAEGASMNNATAAFVIRYRQDQIAQRPPQVYVNRLVRNWNRMNRPSA